MKSKQNLNFCANKKPSTLTLNIITRSIDGPTEIGKRGRRATSNDVPRSHYRAVQRNGTWEPEKNAEGHIDDSSNYATI